MRCKLIILLCSVGTLAASPSSSQEPRLDISYNKVALSMVLEDIKARTGYRFLYFLDEFPAHATVTMNRTGASITEILDSALKPNGLTYTMDDDVIVIRAAQGHITPPLTQQPRRIVVTGMVTDHSGNAVPGVAVTVKGTTTGVVTDAEGRYRITIPDENSIISFTHLGKKPVEIPYSGANILDVSLQEDAHDAGLVVITGIFDKPKESYTGAVRTISKEELRRGSNRNVISAISNIDPSLLISLDILSGSDPNVLPNITMRGNSSMNINILELQNDSRVQDERNSNLPLFIKDGFEISLQQMMDLDENSVEQVTILKDASATALYGTRGANGVVVITSVRPVPGELKVRYTGTLQLEVPDLTSYNMMNASEKIEFEVLAGVYTSRSKRVDQNLVTLYNERMKLVARGVDTFWLKYPTRTGVGHKHRVELEGGSEEFRFSVNAGFNDVEGAMKQSYRRTFNGGVLLMYKVKNLTFTNNMEYYRNNSQNSPYGTFSEYSYMNPYYIPYDDNGNVTKFVEQLSYQNILTSTSGFSSIVPNPMWNATLNSRNDNQYTQFRNSLSIQWNILPELFVRGTLGLQDYKYRSDLYKSKDHTEFRDYAAADYGRRGTYALGYEQSFTYDARLTLNYSKTFADRHQVFAGIGYNIYQKKGEAYLFEAEGISNPDMDFISMAAAYKKDSAPDGSDYITRNLGGSANFNYVYDRRYYLDINGSIEGSSRFGANNRSAAFWSAGAGWNIHSEEWFENNVVNYARLRLSYGTSGAQNFNPYQALLSYKDFGSTTYAGWGGSYIIAMGNPDLGWQQTNQWNIGGDVEFFNNRIQLIFNYYRKMTDDLLTDITLPSAAGFSSYVANVGKVENKGFDIDLNGYVIRNQFNRIFWRVGVNIIHNKNTIKKISDSLAFLNERIIAQNTTDNSNYNPSFLFQEGESTNTLYVVRSLGIDPATGNEIFVKRDGTLTTVWDSSDQVAFGSTDPKIWGNLTTFFRYGNLSLNAVFRYSLGGKMYNQTLVNKIENISFYLNADRRALYDRWQKPGDVSYFKRADLYGSVTRATSRFVMKNNYVTLGSLSLSYDLEQNWIKKIGAESMTVTAFTEELFTASSIRQERGLNYPFARQFSMSVTLRF